MDLSFSLGGGNEGVQADWRHPESTGGDEQQQLGNAGALQKAPLQRAEVTALLPALRRSRVCVSKCMAQRQPLERVTSATTHLVSMACGPGPVPSDVPLTDLPGTQQTGLREAKALVQGPPARPGGAGT